MKAPTKNKQARKPGRQPKKKQASKKQIGKEEAQLATSEEGRQDVVLEILRLDQIEDYVGVFTYVRSVKYEKNEVLHCTSILIASGRFQSAFILAKLLAAVGLDNPVVDLARGVGGAIFGNAAEEAEGRGRLAKSFARLSPALAETFRDSIAVPVFRHAMAREIAGQSRDLEARLRAILKLAIPQLDLLVKSVDVPRGLTFDPTADHAQMMRAIQLATANNPLIQDFIAYQIAHAVRSTTQGATYPLTKPSILKGITDVGYGVYENALAPNQVADIHAFVSNKLAVAGHTPTFTRAKPARVEDLRSEPQAAYLFQDVIRAPHLLELAVDPNVLGIVSNYLGCLPVITDINLYWTHPTGRHGTYGQTFHRDINDFRWITTFLYLTDVDAQSGAHCFIPGTHRTDLFTALLQKKLRDPKIRAAAEKVGIDPSNLPMSAFHHEYKKFDAFYEMAFADSLEVISGKAGSLILEDSKGLHYGRPPMTTPRLACWVVYGLYRNNNFAHSPLNAVEPMSFDAVRNRIPDNSMTRYVTQALFKQ